LVKDIKKMFDQIVEAFGEKQIMAVAVKKFGSRISSSGDTGLSDLEVQ